MQIIYFITTLFATTIGSITGMGGGVIIKPVFDSFGFFDVATIGVLSAFSVFTMSLVAVVKKIRSKAKLEYKTVIILAIASIVGGILGDRIFLILEDFTNLYQVKIVQNLVLALLLVLIFIYMLRKDSIHCKSVRGLIPTFLAGLVLGIFSSFLGIGGGPINVAAFTYFFSYRTKTATLASIVTILFSQGSKLLSIAITRGFSDYNLSALAFMVTAAVLGGFIGTEINKRLPEGKIVFLFNSVQVLIFIICCINIYQTLQVMP